MTFWEVIQVYNIKIVKMVAGGTVAPLSGAAVVNDVTSEPQKRASDNRRVSFITI